MPAAPENGDTAKATYGVIYQPYDSEKKYCLGNFEAPPNATPSQMANTVMSLLTTAEEKLKNENNSQVEPDAEEVGSSPDFVPCLTFQGPPAPKISAMLQTVLNQFHNRPNTEQNKNTHEERHVTALNNLVDALFEFQNSQGYVVRIHR